MIFRKIIKFILHKLFKVIKHKERKELRHFLWGNSAPPPYLPMKNYLYFCFPFYDHQYYLKLEVQAVPPSWWKSNKLLAGAHDFNIFPFQHFTYQLRIINPFRCQAYQNLSLTHPATKDHLTINSKSLNISFLIFPIMKGSIFYYKSTRTPSIFPHLWNSIILL